MYPHSLGDHPCAAVVSLMASPALAHRVIIFAYPEGDTIHTESKFIPDTPVRQGKIEVMDKKTDKVLLTGTTDDQGKFSFKIPAEAKAQKLDLLIVVEAAMGHRGEWLLKAESYLPGAGNMATAAAPAVSTAAAPSPSARGSCRGQGPPALISKPWKPRWIKPWSATSPPSGRC